MNNTERKTMSKEKKLAAIVRKIEAIEKRKEQDYRDTAIRARDCHNKFWDAYHIRIKCNDETLRELTKQSHVLRVQIEVEKALPKPGPLRLIKARVGRVKPLPVIK
jgi:hypothetical protein